MDFILEWWKQMLAAGLLVVGSGAIAWMRGKFVSREQHDLLVQRVSAVENAVNELPSKDDLHELDKRLIEVGGKIDALSPQLKDVKRLTDLLMENELRGNRNGD